MSVSRRRIGFWYRFVAFLVKPIMVLVFKRDWRGMDHIPADGGFMTVVNHNSYLDPFSYAHFQYNTGRVPRFLAKAALFKNPCIGMVLRGAGQIPVLEVPVWVKFACACAMGLGTAAGGWKIIKTMGGRIFKLEPINGFAADLNSALVILSATHCNLPVSTTHVVSGSIMGVGSMKRLSAVRWGVAQQMVFAWVLTIPLSAVTGAVIYELVHYFWPV